MGKNFFSVLKKPFVVIEEIFEGEGKAVGKSLSSLKIENPFTEKFWKDFLDAEGEKAKAEFPFQLAALGGFFGFGGNSGGNSSGGGSSAGILAEIQELKRIEKTAKKITKAIEGVKKVDKEIKRILADEEILLEEEVKAEDRLNKTNNQILKEIIKGNVEENRHNDKIIDNELQEIKEEVKEVDLLTRISTKLDSPTNVADFLKDLGLFETQLAKEQYINENFAAFSGLPVNEINQVLSVLNKVLAF